jgi:hypothetical protein
MRKNIKNGNKAVSTMIIAVVVVVIIIIAAVAAYGYMSQNPAAPSDSTTPTPTAEPSTTESPTSTPATTDISDASSLQYSVSLTESGVLEATYTFMGKNIGTDDFAMRIDYTDEDGDTTFIFNGATNKAWTYSGDEWVDISDYYTAQWDIWDNIWTGYTNNLAAWAGTGDYTYSDGSTSVTIYDIAINPTLDDSLFAHT